MQQISVFPSPSGTIKQDEYLFLATDFDPLPAHGDEPKDTIQVHELSFEQVKDLIAQYEIPYSMAKFIHYAIKEGHLDEDNKK